MNKEFRSFHPFPCFLYYAGVMALCMLLNHPIFLTAALVAVLVLGCLHGAGRQLRSGVPIYAAVGLVPVILNPFFSHRGTHILFYLQDQPITLESVLYGLTMSLPILVVMIVFVSYQQVMTSVKFLHLFSAAAPRSALLTMMSLRFVPLFQRRLREIAVVQRTREIDPGHGTIVMRCRHALTILQIALTWSLEEAIQTADSMKARGYGSGKRSSYIRFRMTPEDWMLTAALSILLIFCICGYFAGLGTLTIYPRLEPLALTGMEWLEFACFSMFVCVPIALEGRAKIR